MYYDRQGNPVTMEAWSRSFSDLAAKVVQQDTVDGFFVSTVWLGLDHAFSGGPPLIFETMIFDQREDAESMSDIYCERYSTEEAARAGHDRALSEVRDKLGH